MKAAVVETFDRPPVYTDFPEPEAQADEVLIDVRAAALSQLVRAQAAGRHYTKAKPPFVPGADGVGCLADGQRVYFAFPRAPVGAMAERVAVARAYITPLPDALDDVTAAAIANPGMSSCAALLERAAIRPGERVLIHGATGASGRLAIGIARYLGAAHIVATGRRASSAASLLALGADAYIALEQSDSDLFEAFSQAIGAGVDIVLDYLWGPMAQTLLKAAMQHVDGQPAPRIRYVNIGSMGGTAIELPAGVLRSSGLCLMGSGLGSVAHERLIVSIARVFEMIEPAGLAIDTQPVALTEVTQAWEASDTARCVFTL